MIYLPNMDFDRKQVAVVLSRFPYPLEKGDKLRAYFHIVELAKHHDVHLFCINPKTPSKEQIDALEKHCVSVEFAVIPLWKSMLSCLFALFSERPFQSHYFYSYKAKRRLKKMIEEKRVDYIFCQLIRMAAYVKDMHEIPKALDYMDAFSAGMRRRTATEPKYLRWIYKMESKRLLRYESLMYEYFDHHYIITEQDREEIMHAHRNKIEILTNGISPIFLADKKISNPEFDLSFVGNLNYPPNVLAVKRIIFDILPLVGNQVCILIAGAQPGQELKSWVNNCAQTSLLESPKDIVEAYSNSRAFLAPMSIGTGLQNKLLEAMSLGLPCITTPLANNALGAEPNKEILLAESNQELATAIEKILNEDQSALAKNGQNYVRTHFSWQGSVQEVLKKIQQSTTTN